MIFFYFLAAVQLFLSYKSLRGGIEYRNFFKSQFAKVNKNYHPFASIIVPCRGIDEGLEHNLEALFRQAYPNFEILFVVESLADNAASIIKNLIEKNARSNLIVAGEAVDCGQKVHNLRSAVLEVSEKCEVIVFVDSDARPGKHWLSSLVAPLENDYIGCTTGYRWFVQKSGGLFTHLRSVWNASIASALRAKTDGNFCWGGSTAISRETFEKLGVRKKWEGVLSDDFALTNILNAEGMPIVFVPQCLTATVEDATLTELLEFTTRQIKITRVYSPRLWSVSVIGSVIFTITFWGGFALLFLVSGWHFWVTLVFVISCYISGAAKAWLRLEAVKLVLDTYQVELKRQLFWQTTIWTISPILFLYNNIRAMISKTIIWRGIKYKLKSAEETVIISRTKK